MSGRASSRGRRRRLVLGLATVLGVAKRGFFIPYCYAGRVPKPDRRPPYAELESLFAAHEGAFGALLSEIDQFAEALGALGGDPPAPRWQQDWFPRLDGATAYAMVRTRTPARLVEVGSGHSTRFFARAAADGGTATRITAIDPAPRADIGALGVEIVAETVQKAGLAPFAALTAGVLIHVHDVFLPDDYPAEWAWRGYNEQQGIGALVQGGGFAILWSSRYVATRMADAVDRTVVARLPLGNGAFESSLWLEKR